MKTGGSVQFPNSLRNQETNKMKLAIVLVVAAFALTAEARSQRTKIGAVLARMKTGGEANNMKSVGIPDGCDIEHYCPDDSGDTDGWCCSQPASNGDSSEWSCCAAESPYVCKKHSWNC